MNRESAGSGLSEALQEQRSTLVAFRVTAPRRLVGGSEIPLHASAAGWDPYEVWATRVRITQVEPHDSALEPAEALGLKVGGPAVNMPNGGRPRSAGGLAILWPALMLASILGLNRGLVGLFGIDMVAIVIGVMLPAARAVYVLLGISAVYCALSVVVFGRRLAAGPGSNRAK
jgi:uncharacterized membrane protein YuzA (DUF378 family)